MSVRTYTTFLDMKNANTKNNSIKISISKKNDIIKEIDEMRNVLSKSKRKLKESEKI